MMIRFVTLLMIILLSLANTANASVVDTQLPYSYKELENDLSSIKARYKPVVKIYKIGETEFGRNIWAAKLGRGKENIVIVGTHHGREWLTSMLVMKMLETYADAYQNKKTVGRYQTDILNEVSIWFIPMLNPDGVTIQQNNLHQFPLSYQPHLIEMNKGERNFKRWKANALGVDLNRQYPAGWEKLNREPNRPYYQFYRGQRPFEAREVKVLTKFIRKIKPAIAVAYHTAGREIYWNYKNGANLKRDQSIADKVSKLTGYPLAKPAKNAVGGGFTDWFITTYRRPGLTIEVSYLVGETSPPLEVFETEWKRNQYVGLQLLIEAKKIVD